MSNSTSLADRINAEFDVASERVEKLKSQKVEEFQGRQQRLEKFDQTLEDLREIWLPRLDVLAKKFGERVKVRSQVEPGRRSASFKFKSELASIDYRFAVAPHPHSSCSTSAGRHSI